MPGGILGKCWQNRWQIGTIVKVVLFHSYDSGYLARKLRLIIKQVFPEKMYVLKLLVKRLSRNQ